MVYFLLLFFFLVQGFFRSFEKGLAGRGGWREEILPIPEVQASFCALFPMPTLGERNKILGINFCCSLGPAGCQPPPANPFLKLLIFKVGEERKKESICSGINCILTPAPVGGHSSIFGEVPVHVSFPENMKQNIVCAGDVLAHQNVRRPGTGAQISSLLSSS